MRRCPDKRHRLFHRIRPTIPRPKQNTLCHLTVILADEPTGALDSKTTEEIMSVFEKLNESGKTIIIVIHDKDIAAKCRRVIEIADGRIVSDSKSK